MTDRERNENTRNSLHEGGHTQLTDERVMTEKAFTLGNDIEENPHNLNGKTEDPRTIADYKPEVFFVGQIVCGSKFNPSE